MLYKVSTIVLVILLLIAGAKYFKWRGKYITEKNLKEYAEQEFSSERKKNGELVVKQRIMETDNKAYIDSVTKGFDVKIRGIKTAIRIIETTTIDTTYISYADSFFFYKDSSRHARGFKDSSRCYSISGTVDTSGVTINKIEIKDSLLIMEKSKGFLIKHPQLIIVSKSPCKDISEVKSVKLRNKPSIFVKIIDRAAFLIAGVLIATRLTK